jgi:hypothetical protein
MFVTLRWRPRRVSVAWLPLALVGCLGVEPPTAVQGAMEPVPQQSDPAATDTSATDPAVSGAVTRDGLADALTSGSAKPQTGCVKLDFLFVIDNSLSMGEEQANLARSFPGFMRVISNSVRAEDFHVMVVDTDALGPLEAIEAEERPAASGSALCDVTLGAGKRLDQAGNECGLSPGERFITPAAPDLAETFGCVGRVGTSGNSYERPIGALLGATSPTLAESVGCNANFLRRDAVLIVTIMTDEDDAYTRGTPDVWRDELLAVKGYDESAVVVLALVGDENRTDALPGGPCAPLDAGGAPLLQDFVESFRYGSLGAVCATDYAPFFAQAVDVVGNACHEFVPPEIR